MTTTHNYKKKGLIKDCSNGSNTDKTHLTTLALLDCVGCKSVKLNGTPYILLASFRDCWMQNYVMFWSCGWECWRCWMKSLNKLSIYPLRSNSVQHVHTSSTFVDSEGKEMTSKLICYDLHRISQRNQSFASYLKLNYFICHSHVINKGRAIRVKVVLYYDKNLYTCICGFYWAVIWFSVLFSFLQSNYPLWSPSCKVSQNRHWVTTQSKFSLYRSTIPSKCSFVMKSCCTKLGVRYDMTPLFIHDN